MKLSFVNAWRGTLLTLSLALAAGPSVAADSYTHGLDAALDGDYRTAATHWVDLANADDGRAQFQLGLMYHAGLHVEQDEAVAVSLYQAAARNGVREAQEYLAAGYLHGWFGLPRDEERAAYWIERFDGPSARQVARR